MAFETGFRPVFTARTGGRWFLRQWLSSEARPDTIVVTANVVKPAPWGYQNKKPPNQNGQQRPFPGIVYAKAARYSL